MSMEDKPTYTGAPLFVYITLSALYWAFAIAAVWATITQYHSHIPNIVLQSVAIAIGLLLALILWIDYRYATDAATSNTPY